MAGGPDAFVIVSPSGDAGGREGRRGTHEMQSGVKNGP